MTTILNPNFNPNLKESATNQRYIFSDPNTVINTQTGQTAGQAKERLIISTKQADKAIDTAKETEQRLSPVKTETQQPETKKEEPKQEPKKEAEPIGLSATDILGTDGKLEDYEKQEDNTYLPKTQKTQLEIDLEKEKQDVKNAQAEVETYKANLLNLDVSKDPELQGIISGISSQFDTRIRQMEEINRSRTASLTQRGLRTGGRYTASFGGIISAEEQSGLNRIGELEVQKQNAIANAKSAFRTQKWNEYVKFIDLAEKNYDNQVAEFNKLNTQIIEQNKTIAEKQNKIKEQEIKSSRDNAISNLMSQGIKEPGQMLNYLNYDDSGNIIGDFTAEEVSKSMKDLTIAEKTIPGIVGEWIAVRENIPEMSNITMDEYLNVKDPTRALDLKQQKLQIQKLEKDLSDKGVSEEPENILAYAQQYSSTGQIPVGLPKGTFGIVAQTAKELPKQKGEIVDSKTGVKSSKISATLENAYGTMYSVIELSKELKELDKERVGGLLAGTLGKIFGSDKQQRYIDLRDQISDLLARARTGAAINASEESRYFDMLPSRFSEPAFLGADSQSKIDNFIRTVESDLKNKVSTQGLSIYGLSKVKIGDKEYAVGDIIQNNKGQTGRILPDGTIAIQ